MPITTASCTFHSLLPQVHIHAAPRASTSPFCRALAQQWNSALHYCLLLRQHIHHTCTIIFNILHRLLPLLRLTAGFILIAYPAPHGCKVLHPRLGPQSTKSNKKHSKKKCVQRIQIWRLCRLQRVDRLHFNAKLLLCYGGYELGVALLTPMGCCIVILQQ
jgi:hypothetical protein